MLAQPSDHHVSDLAAFDDAVARAATAAAAGRMVTFGVTPTRPETGYGYIEAGGALPDADGVMAVRSFVEKPDAESAERYVSSGRYFWNSGMFLLPVGVFLDEVRRLQPALLDACAKAIADGRPDLDFFRLDAPAFASAATISVDKIGRAAGRERGGPYV